MVSQKNDTQTLAYRIIPAISKITGVSGDWSGGSCDAGDLCISETQTAPGRSGVCRCLYFYEYLYAGGGSGL